MFLEEDDAEAEEEYLSSKEEAVARENSTAATEKIIDRI